MSLDRRHFLGAAAAAVATTALSRGARAQDYFVLGSDDITPDNIHYATLVDVAAKIRNREISPVELTKIMLARIERINPALNGYLTVTRDLALQQARKAEDEIMGGTYKGPLHGIPFSVKDLFYTKGIETTAGMALHRGFFPDYNATAVQRLEDAGGVLLGKLHMSEGAALYPHPDFPTPVNPWRPDLWTGASSSGSAIATSAGMAFATLGTDTGGSIRAPAGAQGITGLKPTWGRVSRYGCFDFAPTFDHVGPMARSAADAAAVLGVIAGWDPMDQTSLSTPVPPYLQDLLASDGLDGVSIGIDWDFIGAQPTDPLYDMLPRAMDVLLSLGAEQRDITVPNVGGSYLGGYGPEIAMVHKDTYPAKKELYSDKFIPSIESGMKADPVAVAQSRLNREKLIGALDHMFRQVDILVTPEFHGMQAPTWDEMVKGQTEDFHNFNKFTMIFDASQSPAISLPCGFTEDGRPVNLQFAARSGREDLLLRVAHEYQKVTDWHKCHPAAYA